MMSVVQRKADWWVYHGDGVPRDNWKLPPPPPWRIYRGEALERGDIPPAEDASRYQASVEEVEMVNAALYLRRPLLVTGPPGCGKSSLARAVSWELKLQQVLRWPINTKSTLSEGLYRYDAIGRLQEASLQQGIGDVGERAAPDIGAYLRLGPLGTALLPAKRPRVLLIDEFDKSDIDLPNDLLNVLEEGEFEIPELARVSRPGISQSVLPADGRVAVPLSEGRVVCQEFPLVILTSNGEREFPPAFLRRCLRLEIQLPDRAKLENIIRAHLGQTWPDWQEHVEPIINAFMRRSEKSALATDQLLNALFFTRGGIKLEEKDALIEALFRSLGDTGTA